MGNHSTSTHHSHKNKEKENKEKLRHQLSTLGNHCPFGDDEIIRIAHCFCYLRKISLHRRRRHHHHHHLEQEQQEKEEEDLVTGKFLTDWAVFCSTLPKPNFHTYHNLLSIDDNLFLPPSLYEELDPEIEKQRLTTSSIMKITEEQILPLHFGEILYQVAFIDDDYDNKTSHEQDHVITDEDEDEEQGMARLAKFLNGLSECSRRGSRKALSILFQCCSRMIHNNNMEGGILNTNSSLARAEDLVNTAYRIALSTEFLVSSIEGEILDLDLYSFHDMDDSMQTSLLNYAVQSNIDTVSTNNQGYVSSSAFIEWSERMFPCLGLTLETYFHYIFFPDRPYPPSKSHFHLPSLEDVSKSAFFPSTLGGSMGIRKSKMLFSFSCMSPMLGGHWHRIYTSDKDGLSFNRLLNALLGYDGPTLIMIRESERKGIFGAYTNARWKESKDFCGNSDCFLFRLQPCAAVYRPRGTSSNYMYCNSESRSKGYDGLAHGIGFGGSSDAPRLFIAEKFEGCVASSNDLTFEEGDLLPPRVKGEAPSSTKRFDIESLEVWGVGGQDVISDALQARSKQRDVTAANIRKARKVDKAAFLDDLKSGLLESKAFQHREQMRGREDGNTCDLDSEKI